METQPTEGKVRIKRVLDCLVSRAQPTNAQEALPYAGSGPMPDVAGPRDVTGLADPLVLTGAPGLPGYRARREQRQVLTSPHPPRPGQAFSAGVDHTDPRGSCWLLHGPIPMVAYLPKLCPKRLGAPRPGVTKPDPGLG